MATDTAFQIQYRQEFIASFEQHQSLLRETVTTEAVIKGQQAVFLVAGSGGAVAVTRGSNGRIPARADNLTQTTCTLQEWHDLGPQDWVNCSPRSHDPLRSGEMENRVNSVKLLIAVTLLWTIPSQASQECVEGVTTRSWSPERTVKAHERATRKGRDSLDYGVTRRGANKESHDNSIVNVFASQGNQRAIMQSTTMAVLNRKIDQLIIDELNTGTVTLSGGVPTVSLFQNARVKLSNASVPWDSNVTLLCQPSFIAYLEQAPEFANAQYVDLRPYAGDNPNWQDKPMAYRWRNCLICEHPGLPGKGTSSEISFLYHKTAIGHAVDTGGMQSPVGYEDEQDYSWARCSAFMGSRLLQNAGVVVITHDGSAYA